MNFSNTMYRPFRWQSNKEGTQEAGMYLTLIYLVRLLVLKEIEKLIKISKAQRNKKKIVTVIIGLRTYGKVVCNHSEYQCCNF